MKPVKNFRFSVSLPFNSVTGSLFIVLKRFCCSYDVALSLRNTILRPINLNILFHLSVEVVYSITVTMDSRQLLMLTLSVLYRAFELRPSVCTHVIASNYKEKHFVL
jgi:hypothetical protein